MKKINYMRDIQARKDREDDIIDLRFKKGMTLQQIADKHGLTRQRVHAIINKKIKVVKTKIKK